jgi:Protein of unknown function (DUF726)
MYLSQLLHAIYARYIAVYSIHQSCHSRYHCVLRACSQQLPYCILCSRSNTHSDAAAALVSDSPTAVTSEQAAALAAAAQRAAAAEELVRHRVWFWSAVLPRCDHYVLRWESTMLVELGRSVEKLLRDAGMKAFQEGLKYTALATLMAGW